MTCGHFVKPARRGSVCGGAIKRKQWLGNVAVFVRLKTVFFDFETEHATWDGVKEAAAYLCRMAPALLDELSLKPHDPIPAFTSANLSLINRDRVRPFNSLVTSSSCTAP